MQQTPGGIQKPETLHPEPWTLNPEPQTLHQEGVEGDAVEGKNDLAEP